MAESEGNRKGSAQAQSQLWGARARDWADVMEGWNGWGVPVYRHVLEQMRVESGTELLDVGCGAGRFLRMATDRGADCAGLDATAPFIEIARERVPHADLRVGEMESLPWADDSFDVVTGFNSFFIAGDMVAALREARRVARPGAAVATTVFGRPERCQSTTLFASLSDLMQARPGEQQAKPAARAEHEEEAPLHAEGNLEAIASEAGLNPKAAGYIEYAEEFPDRETALRGYMAAAPFVRASAVAGREAVTEALGRALDPLATPGGGYHVSEEIRYLVATA